MRFYDLITQPSIGGYGPSGALNGTGGVFRQWSSFQGGSYDAQAQDIVFDIQIVPGHTPSGASVISIHGVSIDDLIHTRNFQYSSLSLSVGMLGGMPLSVNQPSPGLLISATVLGAFGNWQGTEQTLDLLINPSTATPEYPANIVFSWGIGQTFASAITAALKPAWPLSTITVAVSPALTAIAAVPSLSVGYPILHKSSTASGFAHFIHHLTHAVIGPNYPGVSIYFIGSQIIVTDHTVNVAAKPIIINFNDLVGQPTWLEPPTLTINTIMRADIQVGSYIQLPTSEIPGPGAVLTMPTVAGTVFANKLNFSGTFVVTSLRSVGQFRGTDADDWLTVIQAVPLEAISAF